MPAGNYETWSDEQAYEAELLAKLFANTYILDWNAANAAMRLGAKLESAAVCGSGIANHWLTRHYIRGLIDNFGNTGIVSAHSVSALLWRDASDFSPEANPIARVKAQQCLAVAMGMTEKQVKIKQQDDLNKIRGGVVWVEADVKDLDEWEKVGELEQKEMMRRLEDDTPVEGTELL